MTQHDSSGLVKQFEKEFPSLTSKSDVEADLKRRGFKGRYRIKWVGPKVGGDWILLGTAGNGVVKDGCLKGTNYRPHSKDEMDFWTSRTQLTRSLSTEFPSLVIEHIQIGAGGESWGYVGNHEFERFAERLGIRTRKTGKPLSDEEKAIVTARFAKARALKSANPEPKCQK